jgi:hypothetical protein
MGDEMIPPMDDNMPANDEMPDDMAANDEEGMPSDFDTNFDAGVEADEETDPKRYIQQLTGKLSQSLSSYNNENGEPDTELGKYVLGMLVKQGVKGMDEKDKKEIIKKINTDDSEEMGDDMMDTSDGDEIPDENPEPMTDEMPPMQTESKIIKVTKKQIFESFGLPMSNEGEPHVEKGPDTKITPDTKRNRRTRPFEAPTKFKE